MNSCCFWEDRMLLAVYFKKGMVIFVKLPWHLCPGQKWWTVYKYIRLHLNQTKGKKDKVNKTKPLEFQIVIKLPILYLYLQWRWCLSWLAWNAASHLLLPGYSVNCLHCNDTASTHGPKLQDGQNRLGRNEEANHTCGVKLLALTVNLRQPE